MLATHLSFPEIGADLFLSPHTVKSQAMSIYCGRDADPAVSGPARGYLRPQPGIADPEHLAGDAMALIAE